MKNITIFRMSHSKYDILKRSIINEHLKEIVEFNMSQNQYVQYSTISFLPEVKVIKNIVYLTSSYLHENIELNMVEISLLLVILSKYEQEESEYNMLYSRDLIFRLFNKILDLLEESKFKIYDVDDIIISLISDSIFSYIDYTSSGMKVHAESIKINLRCFNMHFNQISEDISKGIMSVWGDQRDVVLKSLIYKYKNEGITDELKELVLNYKLMSNNNNNNNLDLLYLIFMVTLDRQNLIYISREIRNMFGGLYNSSIRFPFKKMINKSIETLLSYGDYLIVDEYYNEGLFKIIEGRFDIIVKDIETSIYESINN